MNENWNPLELAENSKTFCVYPWIHQYIGTLGDVKPCCVYSHSKELGNVKNEDLKSKFLQTQLQLKEQELKFLKMQIHPHFLFNSLNLLFIAATSAFSTD